MIRSQPKGRAYSTLLKEWQEHLDLNPLEEVHFGEEIQALSKQIRRLENRHIRIAAFGRVGVGKSSLLNALFGKPVFATDIANGFTREAKGIRWNHSITNLKSIELVDTPGINEIASPNRDCLSLEVALHSDLVLLILDSDITNVEINALEILINNGKPVFLILNRCDQWESSEIERLVQSIKNRLPNIAKGIAIETISAAPRKVKSFSNGRIRSQECESDVYSLKSTLLNVLDKQGYALLTLNTLRQADSFHFSLKSSRLKRRQSEAQGLIGQFATLKASGVAINPILMFDLAAGLALDTALVIQLSKIYGFNLKGPSARKLLQKLSVHNSFLGGVQLGIQYTLSIIQHVLFLASPFTGGISLISSTPVAIAQAAVAIYTTKITGRLVAKELLKNSYIPGPDPTSILRQLTRTNSQMSQYLLNWDIPNKSYNKAPLP